MAGKFLNLPRPWSVIYVENMEGIRFLWPILRCRFFSYLVSNGISIIMCRRVAATRCMNLSRRSGKRLPVGSRSKFSRNIWQGFREAAVALCINIVRSVGTRLLRILSFARSAGKGFRGVVRVWKKLRMSFWCVISFKLVWRLSHWEGLNHYFKP